MEIKILTFNVNGSVEVDRPSRSTGVHFCKSEVRRRSVAPCRVFDKFQAKSRMYRGIFEVKNILVLKVWFAYGQNIIDVREREN